MNPSANFRFASTAIFTIVLSTVQNSNASAKNAVRTNSRFTQLSTVLVSETLNERFKYPPPVEYIGDPLSFDKNSNNSLIVIRNSLEKRRYMIGIFIDHTKLTRLSGGSSKAYIVQPGRHELQVGNDDVASQPLAVEIENGEKKIVECVALPQSKLSKILQGPKRLQLQQVK